VGERVAGRSPFGCEDMAGNVWEWCLDAWRDTYERADAVVDPCHVDDEEDVSTTTKAVPRVVRGGSWFIHARDLRCAYRYQLRLQGRSLSLGFRVVVAGSRQS